MIRGSLAGAIEPDQVNMVQGQHVLDPLDKPLALRVILGEFRRQNAESNGPQRFHISSSKDSAGMSFSQDGADFKVP